MAKPSSASLQQSAYAMKPALVEEPSTASQAHSLPCDKIVWFRNWRQMVDG